MSKFQSIKATEQWKDPYHRLLMYLSKCESYDVSESYVYVCKLSSGLIKFGVTNRPNHRMGQLRGELVYISNPMPYHLAASLEYDIASEFIDTEGINTDEHGHTETRSDKYLDSMLRFIRNIIND